MTIGHLFLQVILVVALGRVLGLAMAQLRQPRVVGEILAGIVLGPSLLGWVWPTVHAELFPPDTLPLLDLLSQIGVVFFLFLAGLELDPRLMGGPGRGGRSVAIAGVALPFLLGVALAVFLYPHLPDGITGSRITAAALFMGAAMSVTAFPVLARILTERNLHRTHVGAMAIGSAAFSDVAAWCMVALIALVATVKSKAMGLASAALAAGYLAIMLMMVRPFLRRLEIVFDRQGRLSQALMSIILMLILACAYATASIGMHAYFGAFLLGLIMPKDGQFVRHLAEKLEDYTVVLLLPVFFAVAGQQTQIGLINSMALWLWTAVVMMVAVAGKLGGCAAAARWSGMRWREAAALGVLMNTRGLMALIVITLGLQLKVMTPLVYTMLMMAVLLTTVMTVPLLDLVFPRPVLGAGEPVSPGNGFSVLIPVALPKSGAPLVQLADELMGPDKEHSRLVALHLRNPTEHEAYRSGLDEATRTHDESLAPLLAQARGRSIPVEQLSFVSLDVAGDIARVARENGASLVLMGFHKPVIGRQILGGTVHRVLQQCPTDVAVFVDRGFRAARRVLVPYLGSEHDRLAMQLAARMARHADAEVTILHIVPPMRSGESKRLGAKDTVDRVFTEPGQKTPVTFRVIEDQSPVGVVLHQAQNADLVILGMSEEMGLESHLFGWRAQRIARDCPSSLLIVKKGIVPSAENSSRGLPGKQD